MKIALLSNVNLDPVIRIIGRQDNIEIYQTQGYGNELGVLLNSESALYGFCPQEIFLIIDIMELIGHELNEKTAEEKITEWFSLFESTIKNDIAYYVSDAYLYGSELDILSDKTLHRTIENIWEMGLRKLIVKYPLVRYLQYSQIINRLGEHRTFSQKMWYMGKILHTTDFHKQLAAKIKHQIDVDIRTPKKVLVLDLDNTLWGGLAGENNISPIILSDDKVGLAYKNFQRVIKQMQGTGTILCIVSKNNMDDAMKIIRNHSHMVLKESDFTILKINWEDKSTNIVQISEELNLGLDSFVFIDDNPAERKLIQDTLPLVTVPDFPNNPEELPTFMVEIFYRYFEKAAVTDEDLRKTEQYKANVERENLRMKSSNFNNYLESLDMKLIRVSPKKHSERFTQLMNKTNQFNLTTRRFSAQEVMDIIESTDEEVFLYRVTDKFGDNGIVAAAIIEYGETAKITEFTMSCRVMGRHIENAILEEMENATRERGFSVLNAIYIPTEKNKPVESLYSSAGYKTLKRKQDGTMEFELELSQKLERDYRISRLNEED